MMDKFFNRRKSSKNKAEEKSANNQLTVVPPRKKKIAKKECMEKNLNSCLSIQSLPALTTHPMYPFPYPYGYALPVVPVPVNVWQAYLNHIGQSTDQLNRNFQSVQNFCHTPDHLSRLSPAVPFCEDERKNDFKSLWSESEDESKNDTSKLIDAFKNLEKNVYQFKKFMSLDQTVNAKVEQSRDEPYPKYPTLSQRSVNEETSKIKSLSRQNSTENNSVTWVLKDSHSEFKDGFADDFRKWRKKVISTLCIGYGFDQDDWMMFQELVNHNLRIEDKMAYLNPRQICLENLNAGVAFLRNSLLSISKYGESMLKSSWKDVPESNQILLDQNIQWQKIKGCLEILHLFGYDWSEANQLCVKNSKVDKMFIAELTLDLLILAEEFRLYLDGIHANPVYITKLFARKSASRVKINVDIKQKENKLDEIDLKVKNTSFVAEKENNSLKKEIFEPSQLDEEKPSLPPKTKNKRLDNEPTSKEVIELENSNIINQNDNDNENDTESQSEVQVKKIEHIYEEIADVETDEPNFPPPLPKKHFDFGRIKKHKRPAPMPPSFSKDFIKSNSVSKLYEENGEALCSLNHKVCEKCGKISLRELPLMNQITSVQVEKPDIKEVNHKSPLTESKSIYSVKEFLQKKYKSLQNMTEINYAHAKVPRSFSLPDLFYFTLEKIYSSVLLKNIKNVLGFESKSKNAVMRKNDSKLLDDNKCSQNSIVCKQNILTELEEKEKSSSVSSSNMKEASNTNNQIDTDNMLFDKNSSLPGEEASVLIKNLSSNEEVSSEVKSDALLTENEVELKTIVSSNEITAKDHEMPGYNNLSEISSITKDVMQTDIANANNLSQNNSEIQENSLNSFTDDFVPYIDSEDDSQLNTEIEKIFEGNNPFEDEVPSPPSGSPPSSSLGSLVDTNITSWVDDNASDSLHRVPVMFHAHKDQKLNQPEEERYEIPEPLRMSDPGLAPKMKFEKNLVPLPPKNKLNSGPLRPKRKVKKLPPLPPKPREKSPPPLPARIAVNGLQKQGKTNRDSNMVRSRSFPNSLSNNKSEKNSKTENSMNLSPRSAKKSLDKSKGYWPHMFCSCVTPEPAEL